MARDGMMTSKMIRQSFVDHFAAKGHVIVPSSSLVPDNDPTLMFTNSGMVQFKNNFTGVDTRLQRAASVQRCVRAGGKHNDLENVGNTARHHTFFEMLGNFSFGDYFKEESLTWGWQWVTEVLGLDPARMCVTVYHDDDEAVAIWKKIGMADKDIIRIATSDNFWTMGETGPCGPCSEIFYDLDPTGQRVKGDRPGTPDEDGDRWMEIWNHVFTQFDLQKDGSMVPLKNKNIDTGAGLERVMTAVQGVFSNYDTDLFQAIIKDAGAKVGVTYGAVNESDVSLRVIADHLRAMSFLLVDGVMPSNEGRGYVLRRIMRRAMRHGNLLGMEKPFIYGMLPTLVNEMGEAYPELARGASMAADVIKLEEERFGKTLKQGMSVLDEALRDKQQGDVLAGDVAFTLYDTYGFPLDLTQDALKGRGMSVDMDGFNTEMEAQRTRARAAHKGSGDAKLDEVWFGVQDECGVTEFLGYTRLVSEGQVGALVAEGARVDALKTGETGWMVVNQTPFYAESGGQVADTGDVIWPTGKARVLDVLKVLDGVFIHKIQVTEGALNVAQGVELKVDAERRAAIERNHSATHLLFAGLREILGDHVVQRGSRQDEFVTRFDISHPKGVTKEELRQVEQWVNDRIWRNLPVVTRVIPKDEAVASGATAQFGEKYGDEVRVVYMGNPESSQMITADLCGGTHVAMTGEIGLFRFVGESSVAAGIRRVEAVTHQRAWESFATDAAALADIALTLKTKKELVGERVLDLMAKAKGAGKAAASAAAVDVGALVAGAEDVGGLKFVGAVVEGADANALRDAALGAKGTLGSGIVLLASEMDGKSAFVAAVSDDLLGRVKAGDLVNAAAATVGGKGGGRPELAQAGGAAGDLVAALGAGRQVVARR